MKLFANAMQNNMRIDEWLRDAASKLKGDQIPSYRLDAELLLCDALGKTRPYLHAHDNETLTEPQLTKAKEHLKRRLQRTPLAYIVGHKEFYGRDFTVTPDVLIPRPETESLIELVEKLDLPQASRFADIGTGSGAIAITLKLNQPKRQVLAADINAEALAIAQQNARNLDADILFLQGNLSGPLRNPVDVIVANLPYIDPEWERSPETNFEPGLALFAEDHGLALINRLIKQAPKHLTDHGYLVLEADPCQHAGLITLAKASGYIVYKINGYALLLEKL
jgi:release factor glutamine methyltransferase